MEILHDSHNLFFRNPFGAVFCGDSIVLRIRVRWYSGDAAGFAESEAPVWPRVWLRLVKDDSEERLPMDILTERSNSATFYFEVTITAPEEPGLLGYSFIVEDLEESSWYGNNEQLTGGRGVFYGLERRPAGLWENGGGAIGVPNLPSYQITVAARGSSVPDWYTRGLMYQIFVDRFHPGLGPRVLDAPADTGALIHADWHDTPFYMKDAKGRIERWLFFGGNLEGVRLKLPYLHSLGVSALYLNPIFEASSNHKYDTADYLAIDPMFGGEEAFDALVKEADALGIALILDGVFSHTGADSRYFNRLGRYPELGAYQSPDSPYFSWYRFKEYPNKYECWWGVDALPNVEELDPSYLEFICDGPASVIKTWVRKGVKGWRLDVADELPDAFIRQVRAAMSETNPEAVLIGEVWEDASNKVSYGELRRYFAGDELHSTMNYPFRELLLDFLLGRASAGVLASGLMSLRENYPTPNFMAAMNLIGSHDQVRILTLLGAAPPEEAFNDSERRAFRLSAGARELAQRRLNMLVLWQMTFPGVPCVYYGDEAGVEGYSDPYNRAPFPWGKEDEVTTGMHQRWMRLRREHEIFISGEVFPFSAGDDVAGFWRTALTVEQGDGVSVEQGDGVSVPIWPKGQIGTLTPSPCSTLTPSPCSTPEERAVIVINRCGENREVYLAGPSNPSLEDRRPDELEWPAEQLWDVFDLASGEVERAVDLGKQSLRLAVEPFGSRVLLMRPAEGNPQLFSDKPLRRSGVLLPLTALPSPWGIGDWGASAYAFVDQLVSAGQTLWQLLPFNPVDEGNSPYHSESALALSPLLINPERLWNWLEEHLGARALDHLKGEVNHLKKDASSGVGIAGSYIDYPSVKQQKEQLLRAAYASWAEQGRLLEQIPAYQEFYRDNADWLDEYALFKALHNESGGRPWTEWAPELKNRDAQALQDARARLSYEIGYQLFMQFMADYQQRDLRNYANSKNRLLMGDIPLFVAADSADCWAHQELFWLDENGLPSVVAGVPPDYFCEEGQRWGNPLYRWERMEDDDFAWWHRRIKRSLQHFDIVRLDHFRGFEAYWQIDASEPTAVNGLWMKGPGRRFFESLTRALGPLPLIAEDLGFITPEVDVLKNWFGLPGMKVLPFTYPDLTADANTVFYTGTHDNDTLLGWIEEECIVEDEDETEEPSPCLISLDSQELARALSEEVFATEAGLVVLPVQDILGLDSTTRMNTPGSIEGNWRWQMSEPCAEAQKHWEWLQKITLASGRFH